MSDALDALLHGLAEIKALQLANPSPAEGSGLKKPDVTRAIGRAEIVLLSSHFERFIYGLNEEAVQALSVAQVSASVLPEKFKLMHSRPAINGLAATSWERRGPSLTQFSEEEATLWNSHSAIKCLDAARLLVWMKAPNPKSLVRAFELWGIDDIFAAITRKAVHRARLRLRLAELVDKRNNIAHGDFTVEATYLDVVQYGAAVRTFCKRTDRRLARQVESMTGIRPW